MFSFGKKSRSTRSQQKVEVFPDNMVITLIPLSRDENGDVVKSANRKIAFNFMAQEHLDLYKDVSTNSEPEYTNITVSTTIEKLENFLFVNNGDLVWSTEEDGDIPLTEKLAPQIPVKRTAKSINNKDLYDRLVATHDLDTSVENHFELIKHEQEEVNTQMYKIVLGVGIQQEEVEETELTAELVESAELNGINEPVQQEEEPIENFN